jgi:hypothetical protein
MFILQNSGDRGVEEKEKKEGRGRLTWRWLTVLLEVTKRKNKGGSWWWWKKTDHRCCLSLLCKSMSFFFFFTRVATNPTRGKDGERLRKNDGDVVSNSKERDQRERLLFFSVTSSPSPYLSCFSLFLLLCSSSFVFHRLSKSSCLSFVSCKSP